ncbi:MAG: flippase, partial [Thermoplasmata archaeon]
MIARKSALIIFTQLLNGLLGYIALKYIALYMQPWEYGVIGFAYGFVALFSVFGNLGFNAA